MASENVLAKIVWPQPLLADRRSWNSNIDVVKMLCSMGRVVKWVDGRKGMDSYTHFPRCYRIEGILLEFLPHWGFYTVGGINLRIPRTRNEVTVAVNAVKNLKSLGLNKH